MARKPGFSFHQNVESQIAQLPPEEAEKARAALARTKRAQEFLIDAFQEVDTSQALVEIGAALGNAMMFWPDEDSASPSDIVERLQIVFGTAMEAVILVMRQIEKALPDVAADQDSPDKPTRH